MQETTDVDGQFSPSEIKKWAIDDLHNTMSWLESQDEKVSSLIYYYRNHPLS